MAVRLILVSILLSAAWLVLAEAQATPDEAAAAPVNVPTDAVSSDPSDARRQRLRNFFTRRREQRVRPGNDGQRGNGQEESKTVRNRRVRPRVTGVRNQEPEKVRVETSVSVSSSVSTSSKVKKRTKSKITPISVKPKETNKDTPNRTTRKRFRLIKNSKVNQDALLEKLLANIDKKNEIEPQQKPTRRPSRFRPSIKRDQIRKKAESALRPKDKNSRISLRIRKPNTTTEKTIITTAQEKEVEAVTEPIVSLKQSEDESKVEQVTTAVPETVTQVPGVVTEIIKEVTTEQQNIPVRTTSKSFEITTTIDRQNFFRRNSPRRFGFGRKPSVTAIAQEDIFVRKPTVTAVIDDKPILSNNLPKEAELKFGSFPARKRLNVNTITPKDEAVQQFRSRPEPVEIQTRQPTLLPQQILSNEIQPAFKLIVSDSQPKLQVNTRRNQINRFQNSFTSPNSIVQPAFLKPTQLKKPQPVNVPETQRSIAQPSLRIRGQPNRIQPEVPVPQAVIVQAPVQSIIRETLFPKFELPDFFKLPFSALQTPSSTNQQATPAQKNAGALFSSIGLPLGTVQGHPRATNLNIITGSYSVGW